jgi:hypothetical protein
MQNMTVQRIRFTTPKPCCGFSGTIATCLGRPGSNSVALPVNGIKTVADLLSKFRLAGQFRLKVDKDADLRFSLASIEPA